MRTIITTTLLISVLVALTLPSLGLASSPSAPRRPSSSIPDIDVEAKSTWSCVVLSSEWLTDSAAVSYRRLNCTGWVPFWNVTGPAIINIVEADLTAPGVSIQPGVSVNHGVNASQLQSIDEIAGTMLGNSSSSSVLAGINGGYFWRVDVSDFIDGVCLGKTRQDAETPVSSLPTGRDYGLGDGVTIIDGEVLSNNCNCTGFNRPVAFNIFADAQPTITIGTEGEAPSSEAQHALSAGPNLVSFNTTTQKTFINIPADDENIGNILEHSANTGVGLSSSGEIVTLVTFDGDDACGPLDPACGFNAFQLAYFFKDYLGAQTAMGMDQGGSTTMYVPKAGGIVSNPGSNPRPVFNGLFILYDEQAATSSNAASAKVEQQ